ncbi:MAG: RDD family protein, partial [Candidatus Promineifilaceae bacterium]
MTEHRESPSDENNEGSENGDTIQSGEISQANPQDSSFAEDEVDTHADSAGEMDGPDRAVSDMAGLDDGFPGWHMEEEESRGRSREGGSNSGVFTRVSLGGALLAIDAINDRLGQEEDDEEDDEQRTIESVLVPEGEWEERFGQAPGLAARHLALGVAIDARSKVSRGIEIFNRVGTTAVVALETLFEPITNSRFFRPVKKRFNVAVNRGEIQMNHWMNLGRAEDFRSRQIAESTLNRVVDESMDEIVDDQRVQEFVQEMLAAQSLGIVDEAIEEIRERGISSDMFFEIPFRRLFRRAPRAAIPSPNFDRRLVRPMSKRSAPIDRGSQLGYYAGFTSRALALAIDIGLVIAFMAMTGWIFQTIGHFLGQTSIIDSLSITEELVTTIGTIFTGLNAVTVVVAYAFVFWILTGQTPGMMLIGLRVISTDGGRVTFGRAILRLIGYI